MKTLTTFVQIIALCSILTASNSQSTTAQTRSSPVAVGDVAPDFTLADHRGGKVTLSEARSKSPVVLVFYRGYW
jgi:peroxiredoxin